MNTEMSISREPLQDKKNKKPLQYYLKSKKKRLFQEPINHKPAVFMLLFMPTALLSMVILDFNNKSSYLGIACIAYGVSFSMFVLQYNCFKSYSMAYQLWITAIYIAMLVMQHLEIENYYDKQNPRQQTYSTGSFDLAMLAIVLSSYKNRTRTLIKGFILILGKAPLLFKYGQEQVIRQIIVEASLIIIMAFKQAKTKRFIEKTLDQVNELHLTNRALNKCLNGQVIIFDDQLTKALYVDKYFKKECQNALKEKLEKESNASANGDNDQNPQQQPVLSSNPKMNKLMNNPNIFDSKLVLEQLEPMKVASPEIKHRMVSSSMVFDSHEYIPLNYLIENMVNEGVFFRSKKMYTFKAQMAKTHESEDGRELPEVTDLNVKIYRIKGPKSNPQSCICIFLSECEYGDQQNITEIAQASRKKIMACISHEFRTPMNALLNTTEGLLSKCQSKSLNSQEILTDPEINNISGTMIKDDLQIIYNNIRLLQSMINSILDLQRFEQGTLTMKPSKFNLADFIKEFETLFEFQCNQRRIYFRVVKSSSVPEEIYNDRERLYQILVNLITNAIKFTFSGGITLTIRNDSKNPKNLYFAVTDTGIGITRDQINTLFKLDDQMYKRNSLPPTPGNIHSPGSLSPGLSSQRQYSPALPSQFAPNSQQQQHQQPPPQPASNGIGLGLTISNQLAKLINNEDIGIYVDSKEGAGTTFSFQVSHGLHFKSKTGTGYDFNTSSMLENSIVIEKKLSHYIEYEQSNPMKSMKEVSSAPQISAGQLQEQCQQSSSSSSAPELGSKLLDKDLVVMKQITFDNLPLESQYNGDQSLCPERRGSVDRSQSGGGVSFTSSVQDQQSLIKMLAPKRAKSLSKKFIFSGCVLIVDDNQYNLMVAKRMLEDKGLVVKTALNGQEAIKAVQDQMNEDFPFNLILMDCFMPVMDGFECTKCLNVMMDNEEIPRCPIVALSANDLEEDRNKSMESGMIEHIAKPLQAEVLQKVLTKYL